MKTITAILSTATLITILCGCIAQNPATQTVTNGITNTVPGTYQISGQLSNVQSTISAIGPTVAAMVGSVVPAAAPAASAAVTGTNLLLGLLVTLSGAFAAYKNNQSKNHGNAAAALAATINQLNSPTVPAIASALQNASSNGSTATVAQHLDNTAKPV